MEVGTQLRQARETRGIPLAQLTARTKISPRSLQAIERNEFDRLPGGIFTRGFLRAYAREVGLDPEEIVRTYVAEYETPEPSADQPETGKHRHEPVAHGLSSLDRRSPATVGRGITVERVADLSAVDLEEMDQRLQSRQLLATAAIVVVGTAAYFMLARESPRHDTDSAAERTPAAIAPALPAVGTAGGRQTSASATVGQRDGVHIEVQPKGPCWIGATADGKPSVRRLMNAGERVMIEARDEAIVRVGDGGACAISVNGSAAVPVGTAGTPATLRFTKESSNGFDAREPIRPHSASGAAGARPGPGSAR